MMRSSISAALAFVLFNVAVCQSWDDSSAELLGAMPEVRSQRQDGIQEKRGWDYKPLFSSLTATLYGKRDGNPISLENNQPSRNVISADNTQQFVFPVSQLTSEAYAGSPSVPSSNMGSDATLMEDVQTELKKRDGSHMLYLTLSICGQPAPSGDNSEGPPPGLDLYISSPGQTDPGPGSSDPGLKALTTNEGFTFHANNFSEDVYFAVHASSLSGYDGSYTYEVTASIDDCYTYYNDYQSLYVLDRDHQAGIFSTTNLTNSTSQSSSSIEEWMSSGAPFSIFIHDQADQQIAGLRHSYCGLEQNAQLTTNSSGVEKGITTAGTVSARQQFYVPGLNSSTSYYAILGLPSNYSNRGPGTPTGGGMVWQAAEFTTNTDDSCQVLFNLTFCDTVSYAVPAPAQGSLTAPELGAKYDNYAQAAYTNFSYSLAQIACSTTPDAQYSLATNCSMCDKAYKQWLCAVTIPRCLDSSSNTTAAIPRNATTSRNAMIQSEIGPGSYNEIPPCGNLCFGLVQNCPAVLAFACPFPQTWLFNQSYGYIGGSASDPTCNSPGAIWGVSRGTSIHPPMLFGFILIAMLICALG